MAGYIFPHRRSLRLRGYDYTRAGAYFITICTEDRDPIFGSIVNKEMHLSPFGLFALERWNALPDHHPNVDLDEFVVMPDHIHGIVVLDGTQGMVQEQRARQASPLQARPNGAPPGSLGAIVGSYKSSVSRHINALRNTPGAAVWQRNFHEHIIRHDGSLHWIRRYIRNNPANWKRGTLRLE